MNQIIMLFRNLFCNFNDSFLYKKRNRFMKEMHSLSIELLDESHDLMKNTDRNIKYMIYIKLNKKSVGFGLRDEDINVKNVIDVINIGIKSIFKENTYEF